MGCNCGGKRRNEGTAATLRRSFQIPECSEPYTGPSPDQVIYMVALGTEHEQGFTRTRRAEAISIARQNSWTIDPLPASSLCRDTVERVLTSDLA